ncbi:MAG: efflux RND transporter periplasmic adaptor subunit [Planctomycetes bacterium]|nr:efflux RND transporter periplasmic adaptor subunit [Planctomycetota bacterium]
MRTLGVRIRVASRILAAASIPLVLMSCRKEDRDAAAPAKTVAERERQRARVRVEPARTERLAVVVQAVGELEPLGRSRIAARVSGVIAKVLVEEGKALQPGDAVIEIDAADYRLAVEQAKAAEALARAALVSAEAAVGSAKAAVAAAEAELANAEATLRRKEDLHGQGYATDQVLDDARTARTVASSSLDRAKADLVLREREVDRSRTAIDEAVAARTIAEKRRDDCTVKTPFGGIVVAKLVEVGGYVAPGDAVCDVVDASKMKLRFSVTAAEAARMQEGMEAAFAPRAMPDRSFASKIFFLSPAADPTTRMVECKAWLDAKDARLVAGEFGRVEVEVQTRESVVLPETAVFSTERGFAAFVLGDGERARRRTIEIGLRSAGKVEVLAGVEDGEPVIVVGGRGLEDGQLVEVVRAEAGAPAPPPAAPSDPMEK